MQVLLKQTDAQMEQLQKSRKQLYERQDALLQESMKAFHKKMRSDQERELRLFREQKAAELKLARQAAKSSLGSAVARASAQQRLGELQAAHEKEEHEFLHRYVTYVQILYFTFSYLLVQSSLFLQESRMYYTRLVLHYTRMYPYMFICRIESR